NSEYIQIDASMAAGLTPIEVRQGGGRPAARANRLRQRVGRCRQPARRDVRPTAPAARQLVSPDSSMGSWRARLQEQMTKTPGTRCSLDAMCRRRQFDRGCAAEKDDVIQEGFAGEKMFAAIDGKGLAQHSKVAQGLEDGRGRKRLYPVIRMQDEFE